MPLFPIVANAETADYLEGAARGELRITEVIATGECREPRVDWTQEPDRLRGITASGSGTVASWSVNRAKDGSAILFGIVELEEGPWLWAELRTDEPWTDLSGRRVRAIFVRSGPEEDHAIVPVFELVPEDGRVLPRVAHPHA
jgi:uncharacterized protein